MYECPVVADLYHHFPVWSALSWVATNNGQKVGWQGGTGRIVSNNTTRDLCRLSLQFRYAFHWLELILRALFSMFAKTGADLFNGLVDSLEGIVDFVKSFVIEAES